MMKVKKIDDSNDIERGARLESFINEKVMSKKAFAKTLNLSSGMISHYCNGTHDFTGRLIESIAVAYPELNLDWLYHGRGEMISPDVPVKVGDIPAKSLESEVMALKKEMRRISAIVDKKKRP